MARNPTPGRVTLSAVLEQDRVRATEQVWLKLSLINGSRKILLVVESAPWFDYVIEVTDSVGRKVGLTKAGQAWEQRRRDGVILRRTVVRLNPREEISDRLWINNIFDMSATGQYSIKVRRTVLGQNGNALPVIVSNIVKVTVIS